MFLYFHLATRPELVRPAKPGHLREADTEALLRAIHALNNEALPAAYVQRLRSAGEPYVNGIELRPFRPIIAHSLAWQRSMFRMWYPHIQQVKRFSFAGGYTVTVLHREDLPERAQAFWREHQCILKMEGPNGLIGFHGVHSLKDYDGYPRNAGGFRFRYYSWEADAIIDVLRLSHAMTYKCGSARLMMGGGKTVIMAPAGKTGAAVTHEEGSKKSLILSDARHLLRWMHITFTGQDMNTSPEDAAFLDEVAVSSIIGPTWGVLPAPPTAVSTFMAVRAALLSRFESDDFSGKHLVVKGGGGVGGIMVKILLEKGASVTVGDISEAALASLSSWASKEGYGDQLKTVLNNKPSNLDLLLPLGTHVDIVVPCAKNDTVNEAFILRAAAVGALGIIGCENNQLAIESGIEGEVTLARLNEREAYLLNLMTRQNLLYAVDFDANRGGVTGVLGQHFADNDEPVIYDWQGAGPVSATLAGIIAACPNAVNWRNALVLDDIRETWRLASETGRNVVELTMERAERFLDSAY